MVLRPLSSRAALLLSTAGAALLVSGCHAQEAPKATATERPNVVRPILPKPKISPTPSKTGETKAGTGDTATATPAQAEKSYKVTRSELGHAASPEVATTYATAMKKVAVTPPPADLQVPAHPRVELNTTKGKMVFELDADKAPLNAKSFLYLASKGFYNNTRFHSRRDVSGDGKGFIVEGGDPLSANPATFSLAGSGGPGYTVPLEDSGLKHDQYVIAAARSNDPDSAGSRFYITQDATHDLDGQDTVFGKIVEGKEVADKLRIADKLLSVKVLGGSSSGTTAKTP